MGAVEIIVIVVCALIVSGVIIKSAIDKRHGKCSCGCEHCANRSCRARKK